MRRVKWISLLMLLGQSVFASTDFLAQAMNDREKAYRGEVIENAREIQKAPFFKTHGLLLFFSSQCPYCIQFAPVVKQYSERHQAEILALSFDNRPLPSFPQFIPASKEWVAAAFGNTAISYPALFIVNPKTKAIYPVSTGAYAYSELNQMMNNMIETINGYEAEKAIR